MKLILQRAMFGAMLSVLFVFAAPAHRVERCISNATGNWNAAEPGPRAPAAYRWQVTPLRFGVLTCDCYVSTAVALSVRVGSTVAASACSLVFAAASLFTVSGGHNH